jgi:hypothetical protein
MKLWKSLIVLAAVLGLGILVYFTVYRTELVKKDRQAQEGKLVQFDLDKVKKFTLVRPDSSVTFERGTGRTWNITAPVKTEASGKQLFGLFESLSQSDIIVEVDDKPKDLNPYGLAKSQYYMAMEYDDGKPDTLFIGRDTPDKNLTYVKFASSRKVLAVHYSLAEMIKKPVKYYRSRSILNVLADDILAIEIFRGSDESNRVMMVNNGVTWMMEYPWEQPGDVSSMEEITKKIADSNKMTLVDENCTPANLAKYGLDKPTYVLNVQLKYGMPNKMLLVGSRLAEKGTKHLWYAKQFDNNLVFTLENSLITLLDRTPTWFIDKQPLKFDRNVVDKIELKSDRETVVFTKNAEGKWSSISPVDKNVPEDTISNLFAISRFLLINDIYSFKPTPLELSKAGISKPKFVLTFYAGEQVLAKLTYGKTFTKDTLMTYVQTNLSPVIYVTGSQVNSSINYALESVFGK